MIQGAAEEAAAQKIVNSETDSNEIIQEINKNPISSTKSLIKKKVLAYGPYTYIYRIFSTIINFFICDF